MPNSTKLLKDLHANLDGRLRDSESKISAAEIQYLKQIFAELAQSATENVSKLSQLSRLLRPEITPEEIQSLVVAIERTLDRSAHDGEMLITTVDRSPSPQSPRKLFPVYIVLDHIRSAFNVGSIFRLADGLGVLEIILVGYTATPESKQVQTTSLGACEHVSYRHFVTLPEALTYLKTLSVKTIALETSPTATSIFELPMQGPTAFIVGNERFGLNPSVLTACDLTAFIPMSGFKNSLNVANTLAIAASLYIQKQARQ